MSDEAFLVKIVPAAGPALYRLHFRRRHVALALALAALVFAGLFEFHVRGIRAASVDLSRLQAQRVEQQQRLDAIEQKTQALQKQTLDSERTLERLERKLGAVHARIDAGGKTPARAWTSGMPGSVSTLDARLRSLQEAAQHTHAVAKRLNGLAARVLNFRRLATLARGRLLAAIPSLNPVNGEVNAAFGYRTNPFPEFHKGLDLAAPYGTPVRAAASGIVASAGWDGSFGIRVDIDHGNGYHTWYCHLSRLTVRAGRQVARGEPIAAVGSTGESTGPHLHYQIMHDGVAIDPQPFLTGVPARVLATLPHVSSVQ